MQEIFLFYTVKYLLSFIIILCIEVDFYYYTYDKKKLFKRIPYKEFNFISYKKNDHWVKNTYAT